MKKLYLLTTLITIFFTVNAENIRYPDHWGKQGLSVVSQNSNSVTINFSIESFGISNKLLNGKTVQEISLSGVFLPGTEGAPNLPAMSRFIAIPEGANAELAIISFRKEIFENVDIEPSPVIPWDTEEGPLKYKKDYEIYSEDAFYPDNPFQLSERTELRGVDAVILGITPFQYNPVTKQLIVYRDLKVMISFKGGNGNFGDDRLRSRWWDPILRDAFLNESSIPAIDYNKLSSGKDETGCEYLIITPNGAEFQQWADSLKVFRTNQGILTKVVTLDEIGGNNVNTIENYLNDAYNTWDIPPAACLIMADFGTNPENRIIAPIWDNYCASDNIWGDVNNNNLPDIVMARMTAQNAEQLETMVTKVIDYERNPPSSEYFYMHPVTALGFQTERWFQICSEAVAGFWENELGKETVRINKTYQGNPMTDPWSTASNTGVVLNVFGPNGLGYIPSAPAQVGCTWSGSAGDVTDAINAGSFMLQHRDHGGETGWGEPSFHSSDISSLTNTDLTFIWSVNCLTGKYNLSGECFAEKFHRYKYNGQNAGCNGIVAASEVSYSFVNDTYVWGAYDNMWPDFLPQYGSNPEYRGILPAFANAAGKIFLWQSSWPANPDNKEVTVNLFHLHGDAFMTVYSEMPQELTVLQNEVLLGGQSFITITADTAALIGITLNGELIGSAIATGEPIDIPIQPLTPGEEILVTVTKQNFFRYEQSVEVVSPDIPYVVYKSHTLNDEAGNNDGKMDYGETIMLTVELQNIGLVQADNVSATLSADNEYVEITDGSEVYGNMTANATISMTDAFAFNVANDIPDDQNIVFTLEATDGAEIWTSHIVLKSHAPILEFIDFSVSDASGNNNGRIEPGETGEITVTVGNNGSSDALNVIGELISNNEYIEVTNSSQSYGTLSGNLVVQKTYTITADPDTPEGFQSVFDFNISADLGITGFGDFYIVIGRYTALILDLDTKNYSGPGIYETFNDMDIFSEYTTEFPDDLNLYKNIFVCLGIHFTGHTLTNSEGNKLKEYLLNGGNLYMEGRITWSEDPATPVHPYFNIASQDTSWFQYEFIQGIEGTFTGGVNFEYDGENAIGHYALAPEGNAFAVFQTQEPEYICGIANDAGDYKTIGTSFEFGKMLDGESPSTRVELMQQVLNWFDGMVTGNEIADNISSDKSMSVFPNPFNTETTISIELQSGSDATLKIINSEGQEIRTLIDNKTLSSGKTDVTWDAKNRYGKDVPPGLYFGILTTDSKTEILKLIIQ